MLPYILAIAELHYNLMIDNKQAILHNCFYN